MAEELSVENILIQVRSKLQRNKIQLWLPPYYTESDGTAMVFLEVNATLFADNCFFLCSFKFIYFSTFVDIG